MAYYNVERGKLPTTHPYYLAKSTALVNPLCKQSGASDNIASYYDKDGNSYLQNPMKDFLADAGKFFKNNQIGLLYAGYGLGLEKSLYTYSIGKDLTTSSEGTFTVQKNSEYGYDVLVNGSVVGGMSKIAPIIYFELTGAGGGGSGSHKSTTYGSGGGGGGGCIRGLIDLSKVSNIHYKVDVGGAGGGVEASGKSGYSSWIGVNENTNDLLYAGGGEGGKVYVFATDTGGIGGFGGTCYRSSNGSNITPGGLTSGRYYQGRLYVIAATAGGKGGNGARGEGKLATVGQGTSISAYTLAGKTVVSRSTTLNTSLVNANGTNMSSYTGYIAGGGGSSAVGQGGRPGIAYAIYNGQYAGQDRGDGSFPGGGGGGTCCSNSTNDYYTGGKGANGRLQIKFAYMPEPSE